MDLTNVTNKNGEITQKAIEIFTVNNPANCIFEEMDYSNKTIGELFNSLKN